MAQDRATTVAELNPDLPSNQDPRSEGAGQIRTVKLCLENTFKHLTGEYAIDTRPFLPIGFIAMFTGTEEQLTPGWAICDGSRASNGVVTPDLRGRFIMGATESETSGKRGGSNNIDLKTTASHVLTTDQIPAHKHTAEVASHHYSLGSYSEGPNRQIPGEDKRFNSTRYPNTNSVGGGKGHTHGIAAFDNRPSFYALAYIMFVGMPEK